MNPPVRMTPEIELLETEESFVETLRFIVNNVQQPLESWLTEVAFTLDQDPNRKEKNSMYNIIKKENIEVIPVLFSNIKQILDINTFILEKLQEANGERIEIIKQFKKVAPSLKFYADYIRNFETARMLLKRLLQDVRFATFIRAIELQPFSQGHALESHLAKPWQRVMKYELLLKEIKKGADTDEEKDLISKLISDMKLINHGMNRSQAATENQILLMEKQKYYGMPDLTQPARYFVKDGDLKVIKDGKKKEFSFILCNDVLFWGRKQGLIHYANFRDCDIQSLQVIRKTPDTSRSFILVLAPKESIQVECSSIAECEEWLSELISLKTDEHLETFTGRKDTRRVSFPVKQTKGLTDLSETQRRLFEFIYDDEHDVNEGSTNGVYFNNLYSIPLEVTVNANSLGYIPYDALVRLDENKSQYGTGGQGDREDRDDMTNTTSDSGDQDRDRDRTRWSGTMSAQEEENNESLQATAGGLHTVNISAELLAEAMTTTPALSKGVSFQHHPTTTTSSTSSTTPASAGNALDLRASLKVSQSQSEASLLRPPLPLQQQATPPRIQASSAHIKPTSAVISSSKLPINPHMSMSQLPSPVGVSAGTSANITPNPNSIPGPNQGHLQRQPVGSPLPYGWEQKLSPDGRFYYVHHVTQTTQWDRPSQAKTMRKLCMYGRIEASWQRGPSHSADFNNYV
jgi:hypothetical protein